MNELVLFEHQFWLQVLGDHARFLLNALSPKETYYINQTNPFIEQFDHLLEKSYQTTSREGIAELNQEAYDSSMKLRELKLALVYQHIMGKIDISLPPTFINHMVNEIEEYLRILGDFIKSKEPRTNDIRLHLLWLLDGWGHASAIESDLDPTEKELIKKNREFSKIFKNLYLRTIEYNGFMRTGVFEFPALSQLNMVADEKMNDFKDHLYELMTAIEEKRVLGTIAPLMLDHMYREECYYLTKLSMISETGNPECDPTKPRED